MRAVHWSFIAFVTLLLTLSAHADESASGIDHRWNDHMENAYPSVEALLPYQSPIASFQRKLPADATLAIALVIVSPAESYATMIQRELERTTEYGFTVTVTALRDPQTREVETWRVYAVSKAIPFGDLSEELHHTIAGWAFSVASYFDSTLTSFAYRL